MAPTHAAPFRTDAAFRALVLMAVTIVTDGLHGCRNWRSPPISSSPTTSRSCCACRGTVASIIIGNPSIADVAIQGGNLLVVTGKTFGVTNIIALDAERNIIQDQRIVVQRDEVRTVNLTKGGLRQSYSCTPTCSPTLTIGDDTAYFDQHLEAHRDQDQVFRKRRRVRQRLRKPVTPSAWKTFLSQRDAWRKALRPLRRSCGVHMERFPPARMKAMISITIGWSRNSSATSATRSSNVPSAANSSR